MRKYYIAVTKMPFVNDSAIGFCAIFKTELDAKNFANWHIQRKRPTSVYKLEADEDDLFLTIFHTAIGNFIIGVGNQKRNQELKAELESKDKIHSFSVRPFEKTDFTEKKGAFYA